MNIIIVNSNENNISLNLDYYTIHEKSTCLGTVHLALFERIEIPIGRKNIGIAPKV